MGGLFKEGSLQRACSEAMIFSLGTQTCHTCRGVVPNRLSALFTLGQACYLESNQGHFRHPAALLQPHPSEVLTLWSPQIPKAGRKPQSLKRLGVNPTFHTSPPGSMFAGVCGSCWFLHHRKVSAAAVDGAVVQT
jgi:hypothetical protein